MSVSPITPRLFDSAALADVPAALQAQGIRFGVSVGRRQPMHNAHVDCIRELVDAGLHAVIVIGSANDPQNPHYNALSNPLTAEQQRQQITIGLNQAGITPDHYTILPLADCGNMPLWAESLRRLLAEHDIPAAQCAFHYRSKSSDRVDDAVAIKPLSANQGALMAEGFSIWKSYNAQRGLDEISATPFRSMNVAYLEHPAEVSGKLAAPHYIAALAQAARDHNPNKKLLSPLPVTMLDLTLDRLHSEKGLTTKAILGGQKPASIGDLQAAISTATATPSTQVSGALKAASSSPKRSR